MIVVRNCFIAKPGRASKLATPAKGSCSRVEAREASHPD
jgi:hypothetical protein